MSAALLVLRLVTGLLFIGHGLQKLVPDRYSPRLLRAFGLRATAGGFESLGMHPPLAAAALAAVAEVAAGVSLATGLLTPVGTFLIAAVMTTAVLSTHIRNGIWNSDGGFEYPLTLIVIGFVVSALGPGSISVNNWLGIDNWAGLDWSVADSGLAAIVTGIGVAAGLLALAVSASRTGAETAQPVSAPGAG